MRCLVLVAALVTLFVVSPGVRVVKATGYCSCSGYVYAYDYYPYYYAFEGEQYFAYSDGASADVDACYNFCYYTYAQVGAGMCSQYNLGNGKGFVEPDYYWDFAGTNGTHVVGSSYRFSC
jgi:hypothetical protein